MHILFRYRSAVWVGLLAGCGGGTDRLAPELCDLCDAAIHKPAESTDAGVGADVQGERQSEMIDASQDVSVSPVQEPAQGCYEPEDAVGEAMSRGLQGCACFASTREHCSSSDGVRIDCMDGRWVGRPNVGCEYLLPDAAVSDAGYRRSDLCGTRKCDDNQYCDDTNTLSGGQAACLPRIPAGSACGDTRQCTNSACYAGHCAANPPPVSCDSAATDSTAGTRVVFHSTKCTFTLAEVKAGLTFSYDVMIEHNVENFRPAPIDAYHPMYLAPQVPLSWSERISGGAQSFCLCDQGPYARSCPDSGDASASVDPGPTAVCSLSTLPAGTYARQVSWDGRNWHGPSDTFAPEGPLFPPGDYQLVVTGTGSLAVDGGASPFLVHGVLPIRIVP